MIVIRSFPDSGVLIDAARGVPPFDQLLSIIWTILAALSSPALLCDWKFSPKLLTTNERPS